MVKQMWFLRLDEKLYEKIRMFSEMILTDGVNLLDITDGATHYHADYVSPEWKKTKTKTTEIGEFFIVGRNNSCQIRVSLSLNKNYKENHRDFYINQRS